MESSQTSNSPAAVEPSSIVKKISNEVDGANFDQALPEILQAIRNCDFVAIDTEFTGLGMAQGRNDPDLAARYDCLRTHITNYSLIQLGISCFTCAVDPGNKGPTKRVRKTTTKTTYNTVTYALNLVQDEDFVVSASSMKFLSNCGLDLGAVFGRGIPYHFCFQEDTRTCRSTAHAPPEDDGEMSMKYRDGRLKNAGIACIFSTIRTSRKVVVVHNGLLDLLFLHASFYR